MALGCLILELRPWVGTLSPFLLTLLSNVQFLLQMRRLPYMNQRQSSECHLQL